MNYGFLNRVFTDRRDILHGGSVFSHFGPQPQGWPSFGRQQGPYGGICLLLKHLFSSTKFNFSRIKSATEFLCVITSSGKVVV